MIAQTGMARYLPVHAPTDGDVVYAPRPAKACRFALRLTELGMVAGTWSRGRLARGVHSATALPFWVRYRVEDSLRLGAFRRDLADPVIRRSLDSDEVAAEEIAWADAGSSVR